jgi:hypothetical protein
MGRRRTNGATPEAFSRKMISQPADWSACTCPFWLAWFQVMPPLQIQLRKRVIPKHRRLSDVPPKHIDAGMARLLLDRPLGSPSNRRGGGKARPKRVARKERNTLPNLLALLWGFPHRGTKTLTRPIDGLRPNGPTLDFHGRVFGPSVGARLLGNHSSQRVSFNRVLVFSMT